MFTLIKNAHIYAPADTGCQDLLLAGRKIVHMAPSIGELPFDCNVIDVSGAKVTTGFIDQHIHITGGGGEGSFATRVPEIQLSQLTTAGTTTVIGLAWHRRRDPQYGKSAGESPWPGRRGYFHLDLFRSLSC